MLSYKSVSITKKIVYGEGCEFTIALKVDPLFSVSVLHTNKNMLRIRIVCNTYMSAFTTFIRKTFIVSK